MDKQNAIAIIVALLVIVAAFVLYLNGDLDGANAALHGALAFAVLVAVFRVPG